MNVNQSRVFRWLRRRTFLNALRLALATSRVRLVTVVLSCAIISVFALAVSLYGFYFLQSKQIPFAGAIVGALFDFMFFALGGMLIFSTGIIVYASLFATPESRFLLTTPALPDRIFASKFQTAVLFSSWAFVVLGCPVLIGYGIMFDVPWSFYALIPVFLLGFVVLPGAIGSVIAILLVNYIPRRKKEFFLLLGVVLVGILIWWIYQTVVLARGAMLNRNELDALIGQFDLVRSPLMPSHWMSHGMLALARGEFSEAMYSLTLLWSNGLLAYVIAAWLAKRIYRRGFDRLSSSGQTTKRRRATWPDRVMEALVFYLDKQSRLLIVKDFRTFRRDPTQWVLIAIFAGLMLMYSVNTRRFHEDQVGFGGVISLLNLGATAFLMCAFLIRFVYPMLSLEGRKFWILGLLPLSRKQLLWGKFVFAFTGATVVGVVLILLSDLFLAVPLLGIGIHLLTVIAVAAGLSGLCVGFGAWMPNFTETDPSKIVVGFGGTMTTVVGLFYLMLMIALMAGPYHLATTVRSIGGSSGSLPWWVFAGLPIGAILAAVAVLKPMQLGARTLERIEF